MSPLEMITEWRKGCSNAGPVYDRMFGNPIGSTSPDQCQECTAALINAIETKLKHQAASMHFNSSGKLPLVGPWLLIDHPELGSMQVKRISYAEQKGDDLVFETTNGTQLTGRFPWTYP